MNERSREDVYVIEDCFYDNIYFSASWSETINTDRN